MSDKEKLGKQVSCSDLKKKPNPNAVPTPQSTADSKKQVQEDKKGVTNDQTSSTQPTPVGKTISCSEMKKKSVPNAQPEVKQDNKDEKDKKEDKKEEGREKAKQEADSCPSNKKNINKK